MRVPFYYALTQLHHFRTMPKQWDPRRGFLRNSNTDNRLIKGLGVSHFVGTTRPRRIKIAKQQNAQSSRSLKKDAMINPRIKEIKNVPKGKQFGINWKLNHKHVYSRSKIYVNVIENEGDTKRKRLLVQHLRYEIRWMLEKFIFRISRMIAAMTRYT